MCDDLVTTRSSFRPAHERVGHIVNAKGSSTLGALATFGAIPPAELLKKLPSLARAGVDEVGKIEELAALDSTTCETSVLVEALEEAGVRNVWVRLESTLMELLGKDWLQLLASTNPDPATSILRVYSGARIYNFIARLEESRSLLCVAEARKRKRSPAGTPAEVFRCWKAKTTLDDGREASAAVEEEAWEQHGKGLFMEGSVDAAIKKLMDERCLVIDQGKADGGVGEPKSEVEESKTPTHKAKKARTAAMTAVVTEAKPGGASRRRPRP